NHDVVRHASRYGLPPAAPGDLEAWPPPTLARDNAWLATGGVEPPEDTELGLFRALAATQFILGLPGCVYLYQGEELGLREVATIAADERQDPTFFRSGDGDVGRDGCRVPLPWTPDGPSLGFGPGLAHLPQPAWFADHAASTQAEDPASTLTFYRRLLALRRDLLSSLKGHGAGEPDLTWLDAPPNVLGFQRPNGWQVWTNFGAEAVPLPPGELLLASRETTEELPGATTVWVRA
ncbi:MAG: DUF3459 domain-containing protein, partial [Propionibacteriaceae bacterium]|nr:DUF3459 domain-containing protein [Propionibacteriaceae bacterium]